MKRCRQLFGVLLVVCLLTAILSVTAWAVDENDRNGDGYHDGDLAVINALAERVGENGGADWSRITWNTESPKRVTYLNLSNTVLSGVLDVSALTNLKTLYCSWTGITELDVSALTNLEWLNCRGTDITELDVTALTNLETLGCYNTGIAELEVSALTNMK